MIDLTIPGREGLQLEHLVCDVNGTLALDGILLDGVIRQLNRLQDRLRLHLVTADTYGKQAVIDQRLNVQAVRLQPGEENNQKADLIVPDIYAALELLERPLCIVASLRK